MKRILFLVRSLNVEVGGGSHFNALEQIRLFQKLGYSVSVHTFSSSSNKVPEDIEIIEHEFQGKFLKEQLNLKNFLKENENNFDLFFLYGVDFAWGAGRYKKSGGRLPISVYLDTYLPSMFILKEHSLEHRMKRFVWDKLIGLSYANSVDYFLAVSPWLQKRYEDFGFKKSRLRIFPNFFIPFTLSSDNFKDREGCKKINLLYTGRITYDKGLDLLIHALANNKRDDWSLKIVGDGELKYDILDLISSYGLSASIELLPWATQKELTNFYKEADLFIHPARWPEPFGRTIVEALSQGTPVVVPEQGGSAWIAADAGYRFINGNLISLSEVLNYAMVDLRVDYAKKRIRAYNQARSFSIDILSNDIERLLDEMICVS